MAIILTVQNIADVSEIGYVIPDLTDNQFENNGHVQLWVFNSTGSSITFTDLAVKPCDQGFLDDFDGTALSQGLSVFGPFRRHQFNNQFGRVKFTISTNTGVGVAAVVMNFART